MSGTTGLAGFFIGGLSFIGTLLVTAYPEWERNSQVASEEFLRNQYVYNGIWWRCNNAQPGMFQCDNYDVSILAVPADIQACRALMCIACAFSFFGVIISLFGLDCTTMIDPKSKQNHKTTVAAGFMYIIAGVSCGAAVSWFAWKVTMEYYNPLYANREFKYEYGSCLYIGWVTMFLAVVAGLILVCAGCNQLREDDDEVAYPYAYKPSTTKTTKSENRTEYV